MKVAVIGGGGREHAIVHKLRQSEGVTELVALPGNGGIAELAECVAIEACNVPGVVDYCLKNGVEYVVVTPDDPLALGMVDALAAAGIPAFGPTAKAARIESSKIFAKALMTQHNIPTAQYEVFSGLEAAIQHVRAKNCPLVVKADGLALGKGVTVCQNADEAETVLRDMMENNRFGESGHRVVIEECLSGPEVSVLAFCDGKTLVPMPGSMDHKRAGDGDEGPNTGGMGAIAPNPWYTEEMAQRCRREIFEPTVAAMQALGCPFQGCLYFGLMLTPKGPKVIEYNCRFGDPETQAVLPLLESDLLEVMLACTQGRLERVTVCFAQKAAACVVLASGGYPGAYAKGMEISGVKAAESYPGVSVFHAGTEKHEDGRLYTAGGRVLGVTAVAETLPAALRTAYAAAKEICFTGRYCRGDIGQRALAALQGEAFP